MSNVLSEEQRQQIIALGRLGWPLRRIQQATGVRRETASTYLAAAGIAVRRPGRPGGQGAAKPAIQVTTGSDAAKPAIPINPNPKNLSNAFRGCPSLRVSTADFTPSSARRDSWEDSFFGVRLVQLLRYWGWGFDLVLQ